MIQLLHEMDSQNLIPVVTNYRLIASEVKNFGHQGTSMDVLARSLFLHKRIKLLTIADCCLDLTR
jgi:hypothetical protein